MATTRKKIRSIDYNPAHESHGYKNVRWVENASQGLRRVDFADEIARKEGSRRIEHKGWFIRDDDYGGEVYRGVVYQLPSRNGEPSYVYGYTDPCNDDCALLCFDIETDKMKAAREADRFAEVFAEEARDYDRAWQAGRRYEESAEEIKAMRLEALTLADEMRTAKHAGIQAPTVCATLRAKIFSLYRGIQKTRKQRKELFNDFGRQPGFIE